MKYKPIIGKSILFFLVISLLAASVLGDTLDDAYRELQQFREEVVKGMIAEEFQKEKPSEATLNMADQEASIDAPNRPILQPQKAEIERLMRVAKQKELEEAEATLEKAENVQTIRNVGLGVGGGGLGLVLLIFAMRKKFGAQAKVNKEIKKMEKEYESKKEIDASLTALRNAKSILMADDPKVALEKKLEEVRRILQRELDAARGEETRNEARLRNPTNFLSPDALATIKSGFNVNQIKKEYEKLAAINNALGKINYFRAHFRAGIPLLHGGKLNHVNFVLSDYKYKTKVQLEKDLTLFGKELEAAGLTQEFKEFLLDLKADVKKSALSKLNTVVTEIIHLNDNLMKYAKQQFEASKNMVSPQVINNLRIMLNNSVKWKEELQKTLIEYKKLGVDDAIFNELMRILEHMLSKEKDSAERIQGMQAKMRGLVKAQLIEYNHVEPSYNQQSVLAKKIHDRIKDLNKDWDEQTFLQIETNFNDLKTNFKNEEKRYRVLTIIDIYMNAINSLFLTIEKDRTLHNSSIVLSKMDKPIKELLKAWGILHDVSLDYMKPDDGRKLKDTETDLKDNLVLVENAMSAFNNAFELENKLIIEVLSSLKNPGNPVENIQEKYAEIQKNIKDAIDKLNKVTISSSGKIKQVNELLKRYGIGIVEVNGELTVEKKEVKINSNREFGIKIYKYVPVENIPVILVNPDGTEYKITLLNGNERVLEHKLNALAAGKYKLKITGSSKDYGELKDEVEITVEETSPVPYRRGELSVKQKSEVAAPGVSGLPAIPGTNAVVLRNGDVVVSDKKGEVEFTREEYKDYVDAKFTVEDRTDILRQRRRYERLPAENVILALPVGYMDQKVLDFVKVIGDIQRELHNGRMNVKKWTINALTDARSTYRIEREALITPDDFEKVAHGVRDRPRFTGSDSLRTWAIALRDNATKYFDDLIQAADEMSRNAQNLESNKRKEDEIEKIKQTRQRAEKLKNDVITVFDKFLSSSPGKWDNNMIEYVKEAYNGVSRNDRPHLHKWWRFGEVLAPYVDSEIEKVAIAMAAVYGYMESLHNYFYRYVHEEIEREPKLRLILGEKKADETLRLLETKEAQHRRKAA